MDERDPHGIKAVKKELKFGVVEMERSSPASLDIPGPSNLSPDLKVAYESKKETKYATHAIQSFDVDLKPKDSSGAGHRSSSNCKPPLGPVVAETSKSTAIIDMEESEGSTRKRKKQTHGERTNKGLRHFSVKVCEKVQSKGRTTYNEVADELVAEFTDGCHPGTSACDQPHDEKNIRRRVYDALNVLMAMNIITKDKKEIRWKGLPSATRPSDDDLQEELAHVQTRVDNKEMYLNELQGQIAGYERLIERNEEACRNNIPAHNTGVYLPFVLVQSHTQTSVEVMIADNMQTVELDFGRTPFELYDDSHVMRGMGLFHSPEPHHFSVPQPFTLLGGSRAPRASIVRSIGASSSSSSPNPSIIKARMKQEGMM